VRVAEVVHRTARRDDVVTVAGPGLRRYQTEPFLDGDKLVWREGAAASLNRDILRLFPMTRHARYARARMANPRAASCGFADLRR